MTRLPRLLRAAASGLASLGCTAAMAGGFQWVAGQPNALPLHTLPIELPAGRMQPWPSSSLLHNGGQPPTYWVAAGLGVPRLGIEDHPLAAAWRVEATATCARLVSVPLSEAKAPEVRAVQHSELLPMTCAAGFTDDCTSADGQLRIHTTFAGKQRVRTVRGGFYGTEGRIPQTLYTGARTLTITHNASGQKLQLMEQLNDTAAYTAPQTTIRYLPGLQRVLLLGAAQDRGMPLWQCVALP